MLKDIFCDELEFALSNKGFMKDLNELRIRMDKPIVAFVKGQPYFLTSSGLSSYKSQAIVANKQMIEDIVFKASNCSIYSVNEQLKQGFLMAGGGIRIGITGDFVVEDEKIKTINNFTGLNVRFPHLIKNASLFAFNEIFNNGNINNTLVISPPGAGKTTFIRDFIYQLSENNYCYNVLLIDERGEIAGGSDSSLNLGDYCDVLGFGNKKKSILFGLRAMNPNIIVTDELGDEEDFDAIEYAVNCGVNIIATIHAHNLEEVKRKEQCKNILANKYFKRFVVLSNNQGPGTCEGIYNENFSRVLKW